MKKQLVFFICAMLVGLSPNAAFCDAGYTAGSAAGKNFATGLDSGGEVNAKLSKPLTSSSTQMTTFGDSSETVSFDAQLTAPSTNSFLEIFAQPGGAGDLTTLIIKQDLDFDGNIDYAFTPDLPISGICVNGVISCTAGTWNNCRYYAWQADSQLKISQSQLSTINGLAGCFCINSSCGSNLVWTNMQYVLDTLGSGVIGHIQDSDPRVVVTGAETTLTYIKYYGQQTTDIGAAQSSTGVYFSGTTDPASIYRSGDFSADSEVMTQSADSTSPYNTITSSYSSRINPREASSCIIQRAVSFNETDQPYISTAENCSTLNMAACTLNEETICDYDGANCVFSYKNGTGTGLVPVSNSVSLESPNQSTWVFDTNGATITSLQTDVTPNVSGIVAAGSSLWWSVKRQYLCDTGIVFDASTPNSRSKSVAETADLKGNELIYTDYGADYNVTIPFGETLAPCEKACKVTKTITKTDVGTEGGTWDQVNNVTSTETIYKTCVDNQCPLDAGETIAVNCTCMNDFTEATSVMQTMESASNDMICSGS